MAEYTYSIYIHGITDKDGIIPFQSDPRLSYSIRTGIVKADSVIIRAIEQEEKLPESSRSQPMPTSKHRPLSAAGPVSISTNIGMGRGNAASLEKMCMCMEDFNGKKGPMKLALTYVKGLEVGEYATIATNGNFLGYDNLPLDLHIILKNENTEEPLGGVEVWANLLFSPCAPFNGRKN